MTPSVDQAHVDAAAGIAETRIESHDGLGRFPSVRAMLSADLRGWVEFSSPAIIVSATVA